MTQQLVRKNEAVEHVHKVKNLLEKNKEAIIDSLPDHFKNYGRMVGSVINAISTTESIAKCDPDSVFISILKAFRLGIEPNSPLGEGYLVPFKGKAQFMPGYRGLIKLARQSGQIMEVYARAVHKNDEFEVIEGSDERRIIHKPDYFSQRGEVLGYYAVFKLTEGGKDFEVMSKADVDDIRKRSKSGNNGPWVTDYDEMAKKTVMKRLLKRAPMSIDAKMAIQDDHAVAMGEEQDTSDVIDILGGEVETSSIENAEV